MIHPGSLLDTAHVTYWIRAQPLHGGGGGMKRAGLCHRPALPWPHTWEGCPDSRASSLASHSPCSQPQSYLGGGGDANIWDSTSSLTYQCWVESMRLGVEFGCEGAAVYSGWGWGGVGTLEAPAGWPQRHWFHGVMAARLYWSVSFSWSNNKVFTWDSEK